MNDTFNDSIWREWRSQLPKETTLCLKKAREQMNAVKVADFSYYNIVSAVNSSRIQGNPIDLNYYLNSAHRKTVFRRKEKKDIDALIKAYSFAQRSRFSETNVLKAHALLSVGLLPPNERGVYRAFDMIIGNAQEVVCEAAEKTIVKKEMKRYFKMLREIAARCRDEDVFYAASLAHLFLVEIHPFGDGNGRAARLCEKWFLSTLIGNVAWSIPSESYYYAYLNDYYKNLQRIGFSYPELNYADAVPFLLMLPNALCRA